MQVARWGNSLAIRLPKALVDRLGLRPGDEIDVVATGERQLVVARDDRREAAIARMRARGLPISDDYRLDRDAANER